jgi:hypothetical protein
MVDQSADLPVLAHMWRQALRTGLLSPMLVVCTQRQPWVALDAPIRQPVTFRGALGPAIARVDNLAPNAGIGERAKRRFLPAQVAVVHRLHQALDAGLIPNNERRTLVEFLAEIQDDRLQADYEFVARSEVAASMPAQ